MKNRPQLWLTLKQASQLMKRNRLTIIMMILKKQIKGRSVKNESIHHNRWEVDYDSVLQWLEKGGE